MQRIEALAQISEDAERLTRTFASPAMRKANELVGSWMREAGMSVRTDAIGNLIGHYPAATPDGLSQASAEGLRSDPALCDRVRRVNDLVTERRLQLPGTVPIQHFDLGVVAQLGDGMKIVYVLIDTFLREPHEQQAR